MCFVYFFIINFIGVALATEQPSIVPRKGWNAKDTVSSTLLKGPVDYVFIHHTYIPKRCYTSTECKKAVKGVQKYHQKTKGWDDIGYSFMFGDDGNIYEGRGWDRVGAHTKGYNSVGLGFSFIGDFTNDLPSQIMIDNAMKMMKYGVQIGKINPKYLIRGHRDMKPSTECPGQKFYDLIRTWPRYISCSG